MEKLGKFPQQSHGNWGKIPKLADWLAWGLRDWLETLGLVGLLVGFWCRVSVDIAEVGGGALLGILERLRWCANVARKNLRSAQVLHTTQRVGDYSPVQK